MKQFIYIVSDKYKSMGNVNMHQSSAYTKDGFCEHYKYMCKKASVYVNLVNEDGTDGNCKYNVDDIDELLNIISSNGVWHIIIDHGEDVPDLYRMLDRENEYQRYEFLYAFALSIN